MRASFESPQLVPQRGLNAVGAQSGWKCAGMPPPCRTLTLLVPSPRARLPGLGEEIWSRTATTCPASHPFPVDGLGPRTRRIDNPNPVLRVRFVICAFLMLPVTFCGGGGGRTACSWHSGAVRI